MFLCYINLAKYLSFTWTLKIDISKVILSVLPLSTCFRVDLDFMRYFTHTPERSCAGILYDVVLDYVNDRFRIQNSPTY